MNLKSLTKACAAISEQLQILQEQIEDLRGETQDWVDERSDKWHESEAAEQWEARIGALDDAAESIESARDTLTLEDA